MLKHKIYTIQNCSDYEKPDQVTTENTADFCSILKLGIHIYERQRLDSQITMAHILGWLQTLVSSEVLPELESMIMPLDQRQISSTDNFN